MEASDEGSRVLAFEQSPVAMVVVSEDGRVVEANREAGTLFDRSRSTLQSLRASDLFADDSLVGGIETRVTAVPSGIRAADNTIEPATLDVKPLTSGETLVCVNIESRSEQFETLVEQSTNLLTVLSTEGRFTYNSPAIERLFGYPQGALVGDDPLEYIHPEDTLDVASRIQTALASPGRSPRTEFRFRHADGSWIWAETQGVNRAEEGGIDGLILDTRVIDERKRQERTRRWYQYAVEQSSDLLSAVDGDYRVLFANEQYRQFHGVSNEAVSGARLSSVLGESTFESLEPTLEAVFEGETVRRETTREDAAGNTQDLEIRYSPLRSQDGAVVGVLAAMRDVTERNERARRLRLIEYAIESSIDWIVAVDADRSILFANRAFREVHGIESRDVGDLHLSDVLDSSVFGVVDSWVDTALEGEPVEFTHTTQTPAGEIPVESAAFPFKDDTGAVVGVVAVIRDVTDKRERERLLTVFDRVLRHNLRNTLNVVQGYAERIAEVSADPTVCDAAGRIESNAADLIDLGAKQRDITRILADPPPLAPIELNTELRGVLDQVRRAHPDATIEPSLSDTSVFVEAANLSDAVGELLENAIVHADQTDPIVRLTVTNEGDEAVIRVYDEGPGIPTMDRNVVTEAATIEPLFHGSGLGLWLVDIIVQRLDGTLAIDENDPRGTVVTLRLPTIEPESETDATREVV